MVLKEGKIIEILTNSGYRYSGDFVSQDDLFITLIDIKEGKIQVPITNISLMKEVENGT